MVAPWKLAGISLAALASIQAPLSSATTAPPGAAPHHLDSQSAGGARHTISLRGRVIDSHGRAVPAAVVVAVNQEEQEAPRAMTDEGGRFAFSDLPPGRYVLVAIHGHHSPGRSDPVVVGHFGLPFPLKIVLGAGTEA